MRGLPSSIFDENGKRIGWRKYDAYNQRTKEFNEFKSNTKLTNKQLTKDRVVAKSMPDHTFRYSGAKNFTKGQRKQDRHVQPRGRADAAGQDRTRSAASSAMYNAIPQTKPIRGYSRYDSVVRPRLPGRTGRQVTARRREQLRHPRTRSTTVSTVSGPHPERSQADPGRSPPSRHPRHPPARRPGWRGLHHPGTALCRRPGQGQGHAVLHEVPT